jgi:peptidoglycan-N-acetylglucosamine deacetylase
VSISESENKIVHDPEWLQMRQVRRRWMLLVMFISVLAATFITRIHIDPLQQVKTESNGGYCLTTIPKPAVFTQDQMMPLISPGKTSVAKANKITFSLIAFIGWALYWLLIISVTFELARSLFIGALALAQKLRVDTSVITVETQQTFVSIIVPAYNEERVIALTINSLLSTAYPYFEVIVVDDGSSDCTWEVLSEHFNNEPRVQLYTKSNAGKAEALNFGLRQACGEIIVTLDADTIFQPDTLGALVRRFDNPHIGAVAGNAKVGNRINTITRWQALEYITAQNLDRRAFAELNCISTVPGAVGAWRRSLIELVCGLTSDTLAEDQDLTLKVRKLGYRVEYAEDAIAWTEAPDTVRALARQRFRWTFGTIQCMWKHRDALFRPRFGALGFVAMPNVWIFQILFPLISPLIDLLFVWGLISALLEKLSLPSEYAVNNVGRVSFYYALLFAVDWMTAAFAFLLEKRERWGLLCWFFMQRFCYRQIMFYVVVKSALAGLRRDIVGWGKLERKATIELLHAGLPSPVPSSKIGRPAPRESQSVGAALITGRPPSPWDR